MENKNYLLNSNSILYRYTQKFYDKQLDELQIGSGQLQYLLMIYENEGISMQNLAKIGAYDKGTVTKGIQKLEEIGYIHIEHDVNDRRIKCLYTTDKAKQTIGRVYEIRRQWWEHITQGLSPEEVDRFEEMQNLMVHNAQKYVDMEDPRIRFFGIQKLTLLDYPGKMACTMFTGGCNFRCPFCHNSDLVFLPENTVEIPGEDLMSFLKKRNKILEGVCISGGEPLLHTGLEQYLREIKELGYKVKLDTNGSLPERLKHLVTEGLVDYVAMDVKNAPERYGESVGIKNFDLTPVCESIQYLLENHIPYEFRTTIVKELHDEESIHALGQWIQGAKILYLQNFEDSDHVIQKGLHAHEKETLLRFKEILSQYVNQIEIRGI